MVELKVDGIVCPLADGDVCLPGYDAERLRNVEGWRNGESVKMSVVRTAEVERVFNFAGDPHRFNTFNDSYHTGEVSVDGVVFLTGKVVMLGLERKADGGEIYEVEVRSSGAEWANNAAKTHIRDSSVECSRTMDLSGIEASWSDDGAVRLLPIHRDSYPEPADTGLYVTQRVLLSQDYLPFISVREVIESIARKAGYTLQSEFLASPLADKLLMSGAYRNINVEAAYAQMGFKAVRSTSTAAAADDGGRVDAWEPIFAANVGGFVDTVDPNTVDENGELVTEAYSNGGCFIFEAKHPKFVPKREISVAFDLHIRYTTECRIASSKRLKGFDRIYVGNGCYVDIVLQNPYKDMRNELSSSVTYKLFIFDYDPTMEYRIMGMEPVTGAVSKVVFNDTTRQNPILVYRLAGSDMAYMRYLGDWAIYEGYVNEEVVRDVELTVRTPSEIVSPTSPKVFNDIYFEGADEGQQLTLNAGCSITPVFGSTVGYGEDVTFADVANHEMSQAELLDAIAQMFNLRIYTHHPSHTLYIEPYDDFFNGSVVDWRSRQQGEMASISECAPDSFVRTKLGYQPADGAAARFAKGEGKELGLWSYENGSYATKQSTRSSLNPLFRATASFSGLLSMAPSAELLTVGDRDSLNRSDYVEPRVVLYYGLQSLPEGEMWPTVHEINVYPLAAFHSAKHGETLAFDDRDGCRGLHRYYDRELEEMEAGWWLTIKLYIRPEEYLALLDPATDGATIRSLFRLSTGGDSALYRLEAIEDYDAEKYVAKCRFRRVLRD